MYAPHKEQWHFHEDVTVGDNPSKAAGRAFGGDDAWAELPHFGCRASPSCGLGAAPLKFVSRPLLVIDFSADAAEEMPPHDIKHSELTAMRLRVPSVPIVHLSLREGNFDVSIGHSGDVPADLLLGSLVGDVQECTNESSSSSE